MLIQSHFQRLTATAPIVDLAEPLPVWSAELRGIADFRHVRECRKPWPATRAKEMVANNLPMMRLRYPPDSNVLAKSLGMCNPAVDRRAMTLSARNPIRRQSHAAFGFPPSWWPAF